MLEFLVAIGVIYILATWVFKAGKREGSRKGYGVGYKKGRRRRR